MNMQRYFSQMAIPNIGMEGQQKIGEAKVLVVGAGGLGCPVLIQLTAMGIGTIGIIDDDVVQLQNLHRQTLYNEADIGKPKVTVAAEKLTQQNSTTNIITYQERLTALNADAIIADYEIVIDCCDNLTTRYCIDDSCLSVNKPFIYGAVRQYQGQLAVFNYKKGPSYRHLFTNPQQGMLEQDCAIAGIMGFVTGIVGSMQVNEAVKIILQSADVLSGYVMVMDFEKYVFRKFKVMGGFER
jgi:sulfur-carrier protein adenylyltransferase/sulfurtransferase